ncbi:MAG: hypothetical protein ACR2JB_21340 [Bryobacteraceae bacterium]
MGPQDAYGARYEPGLFGIRLKPNEEYMRLWENIGRWMTNGNFDAVGPYHTRGCSDEFDPVNFKFYEPYRKGNIDYAKYAYRYFANGWLDCQSKQDQILLGSRRQICHSTKQAASFAPGKNSITISAQASVLKDAKLFVNYQ